VLEHESRRKIGLGEKRILRTAKHQPNLGAPWTNGRQKFGQVVMGVKIRNDLLHGAKRFWQQLPTQTHKPPKTKHLQDSNRQKRKPHPIAKWSQVKKHKPLKRGDGRRGPRKPGHILLEGVNNVVILNP
jgi:hypothetical protein